MKLAVLSNRDFIFKSAFRYLNSSCRLFSSRSRMSDVLIVGLGNFDMADTRHSVGMKLIDRLATGLDLRWNRSREAQAYIARKTLCCEPSQPSENPVTFDAILLKSTLPMNVNGKSVQKAADLYEISAGNVIVIHDELDKAVGKFGIKDSGSARGHNGVKSVMNCLSTDAFPRLRIGIDRPGNRNDVSQYVLSRFSETEAAVVGQQMDVALIALLKFIEQRMELEPNGLVKQLKTGGADRIEAKQTVERGDPTNKM